MHRLLLRLTATLEKDPGGALPEYRFIQLAEETSAHFKSEEAFLQAVGYPDLAAHRLEHREIIQRFWENQVRWDAPCAPPLADLVEAFADRCSGTWNPPTGPSRHGLNPGSGADAFVRIRPCAP